MKSTLISAGARALALALIAGACVSALATPVMEMRAEDLLPMASEFKKSLNLNANQQTLWLQVEGRSRAILRERQSRRERLQASLKAALPGTRVELRELNGTIEAESAASAQEEKQLRELWLGVNDALDENQRQQVATLIGEQLMRVPDSDQHRAAPRAREEGGGQHRGMGRGKSGGGMGMPGS
jgi:DNA mismatch repair protein MutH